MAPARSPPLLLAALVLLFVGADCVREYRCPRGYELIENDCFKLVRDRKTVEQAAAQCEGEDGALASVDTFQMKEAVVNYINMIAPGQYWTSGRDMGGRRFMWSDTQGDINPRFRGRSFRSGTCVYMCSHTRRFWDRPCDHRLGYICHRRPVLDVTSVEAY